MVTLANLFLNLGRILIVLWLLFSAIVIVTGNLGDQVIGFVFFVAIVTFGLWLFSRVLYRILAGRWPQRQSTKDDEIEWRRWGE